MAVERCLDESDTEKEEEKDFLGSLLHGIQCTILPHCALKTLSKNSKSCLELVLYFILKAIKP